MELVPEQVELYAAAHSTPPSASMARHEEAARVELPYPQMLSGPVVGRLLELLVHSVKAKLVLEIGTYGGNSALAMAAGLPADGRIVTCEISEEHAEFARRYIDESPYRDRIEIKVGSAHETIAGLEGPFDFVFIDAEKTGYPAYYEAVLGKLSPHGLIAIDNTLRNGTVIDVASQDRDADTEAMVRFNESLAADERVVCTLLTVRDGITLIRRR
jgi:caffeoyl-CoA O-methyltransferase